MATITLAHGLPDYSWQELIQAAFLGDLTGSGTSASYVATDYTTLSGQTYDNVTVNFTGTGLAANTTTDRFTAGTFSGATLVVDGVTVATINFNGTKPDFHLANGLADAYVVGTQEAIGPASGAFFLPDASTINGSENSEFLAAGFVFNSTINAGGGDDTIESGAGADSVTTGAGNDIFQAGHGKDTVTDFTVGSDRIDVSPWNIHNIGELQAKITANSVLTFSSGNTLTVTGVNLHNLQDDDFIFLGINGDDTDQTLIGSGISEHIDGGSGNELILGNGGDDSLNGGDGNDSIVGGAGNDRIHGDDGNDTLIGNGGDDTFRGGEGNDSIVAGAGVAQGGGYVQGSNIDGGRGDDVIVGGSGDDYINGSSGNDVVHGNGERDQIAFQSGGGDNLDHTADAIDVTFDGASSGTISGSYGDDAVATVFDSVGAIQGTAGDDTFTASAGATSDGDDSQNFNLSDPNNQNEQDNQRNGIQVIGGDGADTFTDSSTGQFGGVLVVDYSQEKWTHNDYDGNHEWGTQPGEKGVIVNMSDDTRSISGAMDAATGQTATSIDSGRALDTYGKLDEIDGVHAFQLTDAADVFFANDAGYAVQMHDGNDSFVGGDGWDNVDGGAGNDTLSGADGNDYLAGRDGNDSISGGDGDDGMSGGPGTDSFDGGPGFDNINYDDDTDQNGNRGGAGVIVNLTGGSLSGSTFIAIKTAVGQGSSAPASLAGGGAIDTWGSKDTIVNIEAINGTQHADYIAVGAGDADLGFHFDGNDGNDTILAGSAIGFVDVNAGGGNDSVVGGRAGNNLRGGDGNDILIGNTAADVGHNDQLDGGAGNDSMVAGSGGSDQNGGDGNDTMIGGDGEDHFQGHQGNDSMVGGAATDHNSDFFVGGAGNDTMIGGVNANEGNRVQYIGEDYWLNDGEAAGTKGVVVNISGHDITGITGVAGQGTVSLAAGHALDTYGDTDTLSNIQNADLSAGNDYYVGDDSDNDVSGFAGDDTLIGGGGHDQLNYDNETNEGADEGTRGVIVNLSSHDVTSGISGVTGQSAASIAAGHAIDSYGDSDTFSGFEGVQGSKFGDYLIGSDSGSDINGNDGNDTLIGGAGQDNLDGGSGNDSIVAGAGQFDFIGGSAGDDIVAGGYGFDMIGYSNSNNPTDHIDVSFTGAGSGTVTGLTHDSDSGGATSDPDNIYTQFTGIERIDGTAGDDTFTASASMSAGAGADGDVIYFPQPGHFGGERFFAFVGGDGVDTFNDLSPGSVMIDYDEEKYTGGNYDGHEWGSEGEDGVVVNLSTRTLVEGVDYHRLVQNPAGSVDGGHAIDIYGNQDVINGVLNVRLTDANDSFYAGDTGGSYQADGRDGNDLLVGGIQNDVLIGGEGNDTLLGGAGNDTLWAGHGSDSIVGGAGDDLIYGSPDWDVLDYSAETGGGDVHVDLRKGDATDTFGDHDLLNGIEEVRAGDGDDTLIGGYDDSILLGGGGNNTIIGNATAGHFTRAVYFTTATPVNADLTAQTVTHGGFTDTLVNVQAVAGGSGADTIKGNDQDNQLFGNGGSDTFTAGGGFDLIGYDNADNAIVVNLLTGTALDGQGGTDTFTDAANVEAIRGSSHNDTITAGNSTGLTMIGLGGNDSLVGGSTANDWADYSQDSSWGGGNGITVNLSATTTAIKGTVVDGFGDTDTLSGIENIVGTGNDDTFIGGKLANKFLGLDGHDTFIGDAGNDTLDGGDSTDTLDLHAQTSAVRVNLSGAAWTTDGAAVAANTATGSGIGTDTVLNIEEVIGGSAADLLVGTDNVANTWYDNGFWGLGGNDTIRGQGGFDIVHYDLDATNKVGSSFGTRGVFVNLGTTDVAIAKAVSNALGQGNAAFTLKAGTARDGFGNTDTLSGLEGAVGTAKADVFYAGGTATDAYYWAGHGGADTINGSVAFDISNYSDDFDLGGHNGIVVNLGTGGASGANGTVVDGFGAIDTVNNIDEIRGTQLADVFNVNPGSLTTNINMAGLAGNDTFNAGGNTHVFVSYERDGNYGSDGDGVHIDLATGQVIDDFRDDDGNSYIDTLNGVRNVVGSSDGDYIKGSVDDNVIDASDGNDQIIGSFGHDAVDGGDGSFDQLSFATATPDGTGSGLTIDFFGGHGGSLFSTVGHDVTIDGDAGHADTTFTNIEHVSGSQGDDIFDLADTYTSEEQDPFVDYLGSDRGTHGNADVSGNAGADSFTDESSADGGMLLVSYDGEARDRTDPNDQHVWGTRAGEHGVVVNLSGATITNGSNFTNVIGFADGQTLAAGHALDTYGDTDSFVGVKQIWLTDANDVFFGSNAGNFAYGGAGDDAFLGGTGSDLFVGGAGDDSIDGGDGIDTVSYGFDRTSDFVSGVGVVVNLSDVDKGAVLSHAAIDDYGNTDALDHIEVVVGTSFDDTMWGNTGIASTLIGGEGDDSLIGGLTGDTFVGDLGDDTIDGNGGSDTVDYNLESVNNQTAWPYNGSGLDRGGVIVNLSGGGIVVGGTTVHAGTAVDSFGTIDTLSNISNVTGTEFADYIVGDTDRSSRLVGNAGNDTLVAGSVGATLMGGDGNDRLVGGGLTSMDGGAGNDTLVGSGGNESMTGGAGNDTFVVATGDSAIYDFEHGTDLIDLNRFTDVLSIDDLTITTDGSTGSLISFDGDSIHLLNVLPTALTASDFRFQTIEGTDAAEVLNGTLVNDTINGYGGNDTLNGLAGNDSLDGGLGNDSMVGGVGDDTYVVDTASNNDVVDESTDGNLGNDTVITSRTFSLADTVHVKGSVENLSIADGAASVTATGNALNNVITGNALGNTLIGGAGADTLIGGGGTDSLVGGDGNDVYILDDADTVSETSSLAAGGAADEVRSSLATYTLTANVENLTLTGSGNINGTGNTLGNVLTGNSGDNSLDGAAGNDTLNGGDGTDTLVGGAGNDTFIVDSTTDTITELANGGTDLVQSSVTFSLVPWAQVENLTLVEGAGGIGGTGNEGANIITGNSSANSLAGGGGNDTILGNAGNDTLRGDAGNDSIDGGGDTDTLRYAEETGTRGVIVNLSTLAITAGANTVTGVTASTSVAGGHALDTFGGTDTLLNIENVVGTALNDLIVGSTGNNSLDGGAGDDTLAAGGGTDTLTGGDGHDRFVMAATGSVTVTDFVIADDKIDISAAGVGSDLNSIISHFTADFGDAVFSAGGLTFTLKNINYNNLTLANFITGVTIIGSGNADTVDATHTVSGQPFVTNGADTIFGNAGNDKLSGLGGDDSIDGGAGTDTMTGGAGNDTYVVDNTGDKVVELATEGTDTVFSSVTYTLAANVDNLTLTGTAAINATGNSADNVIVGNSGNNVLTGNGGTDSLTGGAGNDTYVLGTTGAATTIVETDGTTGGIDTVSAGVTFSLAALADIENLTLTGTGAFDGTGNAAANLLTGNTGSNHLYGEEGNDTLIGGGGNDTLDGGTGDDSMVGGAGNDTYYVDSSLDKISENPSGGTDLVNASILTFSLAALTTIENLTFIGTGDFTGTGNGLANSIMGGDGDDTLTGAAGNDTLVGGLGTNSMEGGVGSDTYFVSSASDIVTDSGTSTKEIDVVHVAQGVSSFTLGTGLENLIYDGTDGFSGIGNTLKNSITGGAGNDTLDGGSAGADTLSGGLGNDTYIVSHTGMVLVEAANGGIDTVLASASTTLATNFENLTLTDTTGGVVGTGNSAANFMTASSHGDTLSGLDGNDTLNGGNGVDNLLGGNGNDVLNGGAGADVMTGGAGDDTYSVDIPTDTVIEAANGGTDTVLYAGSAAYTLAANVENLTVTGTGAVTGNELANKIIGSTAGDNINGGAGDDVVSGGAGDDTVSGGLGHDVVLGGIGSDTFSYSDADFGGSTGSVAANSDDLFDFNVSEDSLDLTGLISITDLGAADINTLLHVSGSAGAFTIDVNEDGVLHNGNADDWSAAFNIYGATLDGLTVEAGGDTYVYNGTVFVEGP